MALESSTWTPIPTRQPHLSAGLLRYVVETAQRSEDHRIVLIDDERTAENMQCRAEFADTPFDEVKKVLDERAGYFHDAFTRVIEVFGLRNARVERWSEVQAADLDSDAFLTVQIREQIQRVLRERRIKIDEVMPKHLVRRLGKILSDIPDELEAQAKAIFAFSELYPTLDRYADFAVHELTIVLYQAHFQRKLLSHSLDASLGAVAQQMVPDLAADFSFQPELRLYTPGMLQARVPYDPEPENFFPVIVPPDNANLLEYFSDFDTCTSKRKRAQRQYMAQNMIPPLLAVTDDPATFALLHSLRRRLVSSDVISLSDIIPLLLMYASSIIDPLAIPPCPALSPDSRV